MLLARELAPGAGGPLLVLAVAALACAAWPATRGATALDHAPALAR